MLDLQMHHTFPPIVPCTAPAWGLLRGREGWADLEEPQHHVKDPSHHIFLRQTQVLIVPSPQRATRERGQRLRLTSRPPLVRGNVLQTYSGVTLDRLPCEEGDGAELLIFKGAGLFCIAAGLPDVSCYWTGKHSCHTFSQLFNFPWMTVQMAESHGGKK